MNTGQMLLVIGALALLSTIALSVNRALLESELGSIDTEAAILAVSLGQAKLDETAAAGFDSIAIGVSVDTLNVPFAAFFCSTQVYYVNAAAPEDSVGGPTALKRIRVAVGNEYMVRSVSLATIVGEY